MDYASLDDSQLLNLIAQKDQLALDQLYTRYGTPVYSLALQVVSSPHLAEEITQDTFMKVWNNPTQWDSNKGKFSSWLLTVTRYTAIDRIRSEQRQATDQASTIDNLPLASDIGIPDDPQRRNGQILRRLISRLPPEQAQVVMLGFFRGMTHRELAKHLDLPLGTVKTRVRLGLQKLRSMWTETHE